MCKRSWTTLVALALGAGSRAPAGDWPQFRGPDRDNISKETNILRAWPQTGPKLLWATEVGQGYAAAAIHSGKVYFEDYDREAKAWSLRCLALETGKELWRFTEEKVIRPNHGITRTSPATDGRLVFALDPKCVLHAIDAASGQRVWRKDLVETYKTQIPPWYNGQNPLLETDRLVIGVGGEALLVALDKATGNELWRTANPESWPMAHASVMPATLCGVKQYLWCTLFGPLGVAAADGKLLWHHRRKFNVAVAPSPLAIGDDRVFMTSGYDAGSVMFRVQRGGEHFTTETLFDWGSDQWNSEVHTPVLFQEHLFAVGKEQRGLFTCLAPDGRVVWTSTGQAEFDLGSFLLVDGLFFVLEGKTGVLRLLEAGTGGYKELARAPVLSGDNVWGPLALSDGKLVLRDMQRMVCLDVAGPRPERPAAAAAPTAAPTSRSAFAALTTTPAAVLVGNAACLAYPPASAPPDKYRLGPVFDLDGSGPGRFSAELRGVGLDADGRLFVAGDRKVAVYDRDGTFVREWETERAPHCVTPAADGTTWVGEEGLVEVFGPAERPTAVWRDAEKLALVTSIAVLGEDVVVADTGARCLRLYDRRGNFRSDIGKDTRMKGFLVPNRHLDFAPDARGGVQVANAGMHRVEHYSLAGERLTYFGRFDGKDPVGFTGCCNPTNIAVGPTGEIVVSEKADPRVKIYTPQGAFVTVLGTTDFDPNAKNIDLAVDAGGRIFAADPVRRRVLVYVPVTPAQPAPATRPAEQLSSDTSTESSAT